MRDLKACAICLQTRVKLHSMSVGNLRNDYNSISGLQTEKGNGLPEYLCIECLTYIKKIKKFKQKCHEAHFAMLELLSKNKEIDVSILEAFDWKQIGLGSSLSILKSENAHYEMVKFEIVHFNGSLLNRDKKIPIHHCSTIDSDVIFQNNLEPEVKPVTANELVTIEISDESSHVDDNDDFDTTEPCETLNTVEADSGEKKQNTTILFDYISRKIQKEFDNLGEECEVKKSDERNEQEDDKVDRSQMYEEYATMIPLSVQEVNAVVEVNKMFGQGKYECNICQKKYRNDSQLNAHMHMHEKFVNGEFYCSLCNYYYKTEYMLKTHVTDKHTYKYVCKKCPEVSYDKVLARKHYLWNCKNNTSESFDTSSRPSSLAPRVKKLKPKVRKPKPQSKLPKDFPKQITVSFEEMYRNVQDRKQSKNYQESNYKCQLCYRGFREPPTYSKHMKKHDSSQSGQFQCDICKLCFSNICKIKNHMKQHIFKYACQICNFEAFNSLTSLMHYKHHKNEKFKCPHCNMEFKTVQARLTHIRVKHASTFICELCGHSFISQTGLYCHKQRSHTTAEVEASASAGTDPADPLYCRECKIQFRSQDAFDTHFGSSANHTKINVASHQQREVPRKAIVATDIVNLGRPTSNTCDICGEYLPNDSATRKHYVSVHGVKPGAGDYLKRYMCDYCGHVTRQYANLVIHIRKHTQEKPYPCPHCGRRFNIALYRDLHIMQHTGERPYQCEHCSRGFPRKGAVKEHILRVHLKVPYKPRVWKKRNRLKERENAGTSRLPSPPQKHVVDNQGDYLNAYMNYNYE